MEAVLVLPNQLFESNKLIGTNTFVYIVEHPIYFTQFKYHKLKLILHRATMKMYYDIIFEKTKHVKYIDYNDYDMDSIFKKHKRIDMYDPVDHVIAKELKKLSAKHNKELFVHDTPLFLCKISDLNDYINNGGKFHQTSFYIWQRKRLDLFVKNVGGEKKPYKDRWTFDTENRYPYNSDFKTDIHFKTNESKYVIEAKKYIDKHFKTNPGDDNFYFPITWGEARKHLSKFLKERFACFGKFQDTVGKDIIFGCHSVISPLINIGLLTPAFIIAECVKHYKTNKLEYSSVEGFIRQIIGWREFVRMMYMFKHKEMETMNHFNHKNKLDNSWYKGTTGVGPIDEIVNKILKYAYAHHIERLMYVGNFMLITRIKPDDAYEWFMSLFIDSYHWVMQCNVYCMSQYSAGSLATTRPYFSSSNYIDKMSSYKRKKGIYNKIVLKDNNLEWYELWDILYYRFIHDNKKEFSENYSTASAVSHWNNKSNKEKDDIIKVSDTYFMMY